MAAPGPSWRPRLPRRMSVSEEKLPCPWAPGWAAHDPQSNSPSRRMPCPGALVSCTTNAKVTDGILGQSVLLPEFTLGGGMERRSFLLQAAAVLSAELLETGSRHFVGSARAADGNDSPEDGLELKF